MGEITQSNEINPNEPDEIPIIEIQEDSAYVAEVKQKLESDRLDMVEKLKTL